MSNTIRMLGLANQILQKEAEMRTTPKFLFELSKREAQVLVDLVPDVEVNLLARLTQFIADCREKPLSNAESREIESWWKDTDATDLVTWNLPPGQQRREYLEPKDRETFQAFQGPKEG